MMLLPLIVATDSCMQCANTQVALSQKVLQAGHHLYSFTEYTTKEQPPKTLRTSEQRLQKVTKGKTRPLVIQRIIAKHRQHKRRDESKNSTPCNIRSYHPSK